MGCKGRTPLLVEEACFLKLFYIYDVNTYFVVFAENEQNAFEKMKRKRKKLLHTLGASLDINDWNIEEFTPDSYEGILCFY